MMDTSNLPSKEFVIQRASETLCEWWTGSGWSEYQNDAKHYEHEPDVSKETGDESAKVLSLETKMLTPGL